MAYTDFDLVKILRDNDYEASDKAVAELREDINEGLVFVLHADKEVLTESVTIDGFLAHVLDENGYEISEKNLATLKSGIKAGTYLLTSLKEDDEKEDKPAAVEPAAVEKKDAGDGKDEHAEKIADSARKNALAKGLPSDAAEKIADRVYRMIAARDAKRAAAKDVADPAAAVTPTTAKEDMANAKKVVDAAAPAVEDKKEEEK